MTTELTETVSDMTTKEAEETDKLIRESEAMKRIRVFLMWKRNGFAKLGYKTFEEYCENRIDTPKRTAYHWIQQVEITILTKKIKLKDLCQLGTNEKEKDKLLTVAASAELAKLKDNPDKMREAYTQYEAVYKDNPVGDLAVQCLRRIVKLQLKPKEETPSVSAPEPDNVVSMTEPDAVVLIEDRELTEHEKQVGRELAETLQEPKELEMELSEPDEETAPRIVVINARSVQKDDSLHCLLIDFCLPDSDDISVLRVPYALLPRECQP